MSRNSVPRICESGFKVAGDQRLEKETIGRSVQTRHVTRMSVKVGYHQGWVIVSRDL